MQICGSGSRRHGSRSGSNLWYKKMAPDPAVKNTGSESDSWKQPWSASLLAINILFSFRFIIAPQKLYMHIYLHSILSVVSKEILKVFLFVSLKILIKEPWEQLTNYIQEYLRKNITYFYFFLLFKLLLYKMVTRNILHRREGKWNEIIRFVTVFDLSNAFYRFKNINNKK